MLFNMIAETTVQRAGLTRVETKIYIGLLNLGPSLAGQISKYSGIHRRSVYDALDRLAEKGLVSYIVRNNRRYFQATNPNRLIEIVKEKEAEIQTAIPSLRELFTKTKVKEETLFYRGIDGLRSAFEDQLEERKEICIIGASPQAGEILRFYFRWYGKKRKQMHIKMKLIADESARGKITATLSEIKYLPSLGPAAMNIYADKVSIILWSKERPIAIIIKNKEISDSYRSFFEHMWKLAKK